MTADSWLKVAHDGPKAVVAGEFDPKVHPSGDEALRVAAAFASCGTFAEQGDARAQFTLGLM